MFREVVPVIGLFLAEEFFSNNIPHMKKFLQSHPEITLIVLAIMLIVVLVFYFSWGMGVVVANFNAALKIPVITEKPVGFDLQTAKSLNLKLE